MEDGKFIFIDTHILLWMASNGIKNLTATARKSMDGIILKISPMSVLELHYLYEIKRIPVKPYDMLDRFKQFLHIEISKSDFTEVCEIANGIGWTRDTFDRIIVAEATLHKAKLVTADEKILKHYKRAVW